MEMSESERRHLAAASAHLHLAAAAHYMAEARAPPRLDIEMGLGLGGHSELAHGRGHGDGLGHGGHGDGHGLQRHGDDDDDGLQGHDSDDDDALQGHGGDDDADEELEWTMQDLYDLMLLLASFVPPAPAYKALLRDVVEGLAWTWVILAYGVFLAVAVTTFSLRVLGLGTSTSCLPTFLRLLLLSATLVSEVFAAIYLMPATTLTAVGACFTVVLLLAFHLIACRRCR